MRFTILGLAALLASCDSASGPRLGDEFTLRIGETAAVSELNLWMRFITVTADSRCPQNVTCVWAGDGAVLIEVAPLNGDSKETELHTNGEPSSIPLGKATLQLVKLEPFPVSPGSISLRDYVVTLRTEPVP